MKSASDQAIEYVTKQTGKQKPLEEIDVTLENREEQNRGSAKSRNGDCVRSMAPDCLEYDLPVLHRHAILGSFLVHELRRPLFSGYVRIFAREHKVERPGAGDGQSVGLCWFELPLPRSVHRYLREVFAWSGRFKAGISYIAAGIDADPYAYVHSTPNRLAG